jgi:hypothetical protein
LAHPGVKTLANGGGRSYDRKKERRQPNMRQVTVVPDKDKYEYFRNKQEKMGYPAKSILIESLIDGIRIAKEFEEKPNPPKLTVVSKTGKNQKPETKPKSNMTRIGPSPAPPETTKLNLDIEDGLYGELKKEAEKEGTETTKLINGWVIERMEASIPTISETTRDMFAYIGLPMLRPVK